MGYFPFGMMSVIPAIVIIGFIVILGLFVVNAIRGGMEWSRNNNSPILTIRARVVAKRHSVSHHSHPAGDGMHHSTSSSSYYATFEAENGARVEFHLSGQEFGLLAEGDVGELTYQGTRYKGFTRHLQ